MFKKVLQSSLRRPSLLFPFTKISQMMSPFSSVSSKVMFRVYPNNETSSLYYFNLTSPISKIEKILSEDMGHEVQFATSSIDHEKHYQQLDYCDSKMTLDDVQALDVDAVLSGGNGIMSFTVGTQLSLNPLLENDYGQILQNMEVPINDAIVISHFMDKVNDQLVGKSFSSKQIRNALSKTLSKFRASTKDRQGLLATALTNQQGRYNRLMNQIDIIKAASDKQGSNYIYGAIGFTVLIQFSLLFYLTYWVYDWDFCEPIDYLYGSLLEAIALYLFINREGDFCMDDIYEEYYDQVYDKDSTLVSGHLKIDVQNLKRRIAIVQKQMATLNPIEKKKLNPS